jgi:hypothetical protein
MILNVPRIYQRTLKKKTAAEWENRKKSINRKVKNTFTRKDAKKLFQKWVRLRDAEQPCISKVVVTIKTFGMEVILKAEIHSGVIFNPAKLP